MKSSIDAKWIVTASRRPRWAAAICLLLLCGVTAAAHAADTAVSVKPTSVFLGHLDTITALAFDPGGARFASGSKDNTIKLWEIASGEELETYRGHTHPITSLVYSRKDNLLLSGSEDGTLRVWDLDSDDPARVLLGGGEPVSDLALSADATEVLTAAHGFQEWTIETGVIKHSYPANGNDLLSVCYTPDNKQAITGGADGTVRLWDLKADKESLRFSGFPAGVRRVRVTPDGKTAAACCWGDGAIRLMDLTTGKEIQKLVGDADAVTSLAFSPDGKTLITAGGKLGSDLKTLSTSKSIDEPVDVWNVATGKVTARLTGLTGYIGAVAFSPDGKQVIAGGSDNSVGIWKLP